MTKPIKNLTRELLQDALDELLRLGAEEPHEPGVGPWANPICNAIHLGYPLTPLPKWLKNKPNKKEHED